MTKEQFKREKMYQATMSIARQMYKAGLLTEKELAAADKLFREKYTPPLGGLSPSHP
jgi:hypothetical protein